MSVIVILIFISLSLALLFLAGFIWAVRSGQFEDTCTPAMRVLIEGETSTGKTTGPAKQPLINTPLQRVGTAREGALNRFSGFRGSGTPSHELETTEAVSGPQPHAATPLKRGVNETTVTKVPKFPELSKPNLKSS